MIYVHFQFVSFSTMISRKLLLFVLLLACTTKVASQTKTACTDCIAMTTQCPICRQVGQPERFTIPTVFNYLPPNCNTDHADSVRCNSQINCFTTSICTSEPSQTTSPDPEDLKTDLSQTKAVTRDSTSTTIAASTTSDPQPSLMRTTTAELVLSLATVTPATGSKLEVSTTTEVATLHSSVSVAESANSHSTEIGAGITTVSPTVVDAQLIGAIVGGILGFLLLLAIVVAVFVAVARSRRRARAEVSDSGIVAKPSMQTYSHSQPSSHYASAPPEVNYDSAGSAFHF